MQSAVCTPAFPSQFEISEPPCPVSVTVCACDLTGMLTVLYTE